jgi:xanthine dehydrogenase accessory factor
MTHWLDFLSQRVSRGERAVIVSVASTRGSAPREAGTRMVVTRDGVHGTIGGGHLEHQAIGIARDLLGGSDEPPERLRRFPLGASLGQCCGGLVNLLFEPVAGPPAWLDAAAACARRRVPCVLVTPTRGPVAAGKLVVTADDVVGSLGAFDAEAIEAARGLLARSGAAALHRCGDGDDARLLYLDPVPVTAFEIVLFGAGHVARALVRILADLPCQVTWVDARDQEFPREIPANATVACTDGPEAEVDAAPPGSFFLVMTHSHALDEALAERILKRFDFAYFGLIGSLTKRRQFERRMERRGMPPARLEAMTCPIGVAGIHGKEPAVIAIAVAAELLQVRAQATPGARREAAPRVIRGLERDG